jgi:hypothetical protein
VAAPAIAEVTTLAISMGVFYAVNLSPLLLFDPDAFMRKYNIPPLLMILCLLILWPAAIIIFGLRMRDKISAQFDVWMSRHALLVGVFIFLIARVFAFTMAVHDVRNR